MYRLFGFIILLMATALFAETQEEAYYRAMKLEEAGDIPAALEAFEDAAALPGDYTEEIQEIIREYKVALGKSDEMPMDSSGVENNVNSWDFHVAGELGFYGMHYKATGMDEGEIGGDLFLNVNPYVDYELGNWLHTFSAYAQGDYYMNNDKMTMLDTNDASFVLGLEYTLFGKGLLLDLGYDFNIEGEELSSDFYAWIEKDLYRFEKQRLGVVGWAYYQTSGPMSYALYASWHRTVSEGLNGTVYVGAKLDGDSISLLHEKPVNDSLADVTTVEWLGAVAKWFGPVLRSRISYKFKNRITVEAKMNLSYGFAVGSTDSDYEKSKKFYGLWGATVSWKHWKMNYYLGLERSYTRYYWSGIYKKVNNESTSLNWLKLGVKWDI